MSTAVDERAAAARSRRAWWLVPEFAGVAILALVALPFLGTGSGQQGLRGEVALRAAAVIEKATPAEHHDHGHEVTGNERIYCGVHLFGTDPPSVTVIEDVSIVYGYYFCAMGSPGVPYNESSRSDGPVVVTLKGTQQATIALSGQGYAERVRAMMPDQYENQCFRGLPDASVAQGVRDRYEG